MSKVIWILNQTAGKPDSGWGERHYYFSRYWVKKGYKVTIISGSYNHLFKNQPITENKIFTLEEVEDGISFCWVKTPKYRDSGFAKFWSNFVFTFKILFLPSNKLGKPDIIIMSSMPIFPIVSAVRLKNKFKATKLITEIRDLWPLTPMYLKGYSKYHPLVKIVGWFECFAYQKSDKIVSLLPNASEYIASLSKDVSKFEYIPNGIDEALLVNEPLSKEIIDKMPKDKFIIGYTGTMGKANALEYFVEASILLKNNPKIHFVLVGDGYLKKELVEKTFGQNNITFIPKINKNQVQQILSYFDVCFIGRNDIPLFDYGVSSNKYFDYMLAKKPVLVSSNRIKDPVELSNCGITVKPESAETIKDGILQLFQLSKEEMDKFSENGYNYVKKYHNFNFLSEAYLKLF
jgi:glycosyltransferase involved in cell wall biosynthesis